jgi:hypothetical protein
MIAMPHNRSRAMLGPSLANAECETTEFVPLNLTDLERIECQKAAERCGLSLREWIRSRLWEAVQRESKDA